MIEQMVMEHGLGGHSHVRLLPHRRAAKGCTGAGMNQLRLSFCFSESAGQARRDDMREAITAFCKAAKALVGITA